MQYDLHYQTSKEKRTSTKTSKKQTIKASPKHSLLHKSLHSSNPKMSLSPSDMLPPCTMFFLNKKCLNERATSIREKFIVLHSKMHKCSTNSFSASNVTTAFNLELSITSFNDSFSRKKKMT